MDYKIGQWVIIIQNDYGAAAAPIGRVTSVPDSKHGVHVKTAAYRVPLYHFLYQIQPIDLSMLEEIIYGIAH